MKQNRSMQKNLKLINIHFICLLLLKSCCKKDGQPSTPPTKVARLFSYFCTKIYQIKTIPFIKYQVLIFDK